MYLTRVPIRLALFLAIERKALLQMARRIDVIYRQRAFLIKSTAGSVMYDLSEYDSGFESGGGDYSQTTTKDNDGGGDGESQEGDTPSGGQKEDDGARPTFEDGRLPCVLQASRHGQLGSAVADFSHRVNQKDDDDDDMYVHGTRAWRSVELAAIVDLPRHVRGGLPGGD